MRDSVISKGLSEKTIELFEQIPYPVIIHRNGTIVEANSEAVLLSKVTDKDDLLGMSVLSLLTEPSRQKAIALMVSEQAYGTEIFELIDQQNTYRIVEVKKSYFQDNQCSFAFLMIKDITEYRRGLVRAANIQKASMKTAAPFGEAITIRCGYYPKDIVSGDFYYFDHRESGFINGILGDVKGNGISASLNTSAMKILYHEAVKDKRTTLDIAEAMNDGIIRLLNEEFVAAIIYQIDLNKRQLDVTGAGIAEFLCRKGNGLIERHMVKGPFLGMLCENLFEHRQLPLEEGAEYFFYSDGLEMAGIEAQIESLEQAHDFQERVDLLTRLCDESPKDDKSWLAIRIDRSE